MTSLNLLLWIVLGIVLQVGLFLGISFWQHWQSYSRLRQGLPEAAEALPAVDVPQKTHGRLVRIPSLQGGPTRRRRFGQAHLLVLP
jgi:hypothetical protein